MQFYSFHANISYQSVQFIERLLIGQIGQTNAGATILLSSGGGDSAAGIGLYYLLKALPYPVHIHAAGICASGGVSLLAAATRRTCSPGTHFMLHGSMAGDGSLSPQVVISRDIFKHALGWDHAKLDHYFSDVAEKWFDENTALADGLVEVVEHFSFPANANVFMVPN